MTGEIVIMMCSEKKRQIKTTKTFIPIFYAKLKAENFSLIDLGRMDAR